MLFEAKLDKSIFENVFPDSNSVKNALRRAASNWLLYHKKCILTIFERGGNVYSERPDIYAVTEKRELIEIEIKRTVSDFRANKRKTSRIYYESHIDEGCNYFYYIVSLSIAEKVLPEVEPKFGLMTLESRRDYFGGVCVVKRAKKIHDKKLSVKRMCQLLRAYSGTVSGILDELNIAQANLQEYRQN